MLLLCAALRQNKDEGGEQEKAAPMDVDIEYRVPSTPSTDDETQQAKHKNEVVALEAKISFLEQELTRRDRGALIGSFHIHHREPGRYFRGVDTFEYLEYYQQINILWVFVEIRIPGAIVCLSTKWLILGGGASLL